jgi:integrase
VSVPLVKTGTPGIYRRGSRYVVTFRDLSGRQCKRSAPTLAAARDLKAQLVADVSRGDYRTQSRVRFPDYCDEWLATYQGRTSTGIREDTLAEYRRALLGQNAHGEPLLRKDGKPMGAVAFFGARRLPEIEPRDIRRYIAELFACGYAWDTVRLFLAPVKALFATALEDGLIRSNPTAGIRIPRPARAPDEEERRKALTLGQVLLLLAAVRPEYRLLVELLVETGLRVSEAIGLRWSDLDLGQGVLHVRRRRYKGREDAPKTRYGRRQVRLSEETARALWTLRKERGVAADDAHVFVGRGGVPLHPSTVWRVLHEAGERIGVHVSAHVLRHTCGSLLYLEEGWNDKEVQRALGHHKASFTLDTYIHLLPREEPRAPSFLRRGGGNRVATQATETGRNLRVAASRE